jgi:hypothetical protein
MMAFLGGHYDPDPLSNVNREANTAGGRGKAEGGTGNGKSGSGGKEKEIDELTNRRITN